MNNQTNMRNALNFLADKGLETIDFTLETSWGTRVTATIEHSEITEEEMRDIKRHFGGPKGLEIVDQYQAKGLKGEVELPMGGSIVLTVSQAYTCKILKTEDVEELTEDHWGAIREHVEAGRIKITDCTAALHLNEEEPSENEAGPVSMEVLTEPEAGF